MRSMESLTAKDYFRILALYNYVKENGITIFSENNITLYNVLKLPEFIEEPNNIEDCAPFNTDIVEFKLDMYNLYKFQFEYDLPIKIRCDLERYAVAVRKGFKWSRTI